MSDPTPGPARPSPSPSLPRVRVTSPRTAGGRPRPAQTATSEIDAQTPLGQIYMRSLLRTQLRLALGVLAVLAVCLGGLPLLFHLAPGAMATQVFGVPISWILLAFAGYPLLVVLGWWYVRAAERNERAFTDVVERS